MLIRNRVLAVCQNPRFKVSGPLCQKSARNPPSKQHGEFLVNLQKKHLNSLCYARLMQEHNKEGRSALAVLNFGHCAIAVKLQLEVTQPVHLRGL